MIILSSEKINTCRKNQDKILRPVQDFGSENSYKNLSLKTTKIFFSWNTALISKVIAVLLSSKIIVIFYTFCSYLYTNLRNSKYSRLGLIHKYYASVGISEKVQQ